MENTSREQTPTQQLQHTLKTWYEDTPTTRRVCYFLILWSFLTWFLPLDVTESTAEYWFIATANPSPGWVLGAFSHVGLEHLLTNIGLLIIFGAIPERRLSTRQFLTFLIAAGLLTTLVQVLEYILNGVTGGMVGASGASYAVVSFTLTTLYLTNTSDSKLNHTSRISFRPGVSAAALIIILGQLINDFTPFLSIAPKASGVGHLTGMILGALTAVLHDHSSDG